MFAQTVLQLRPFRLFAAMLGFILLLSVPVSVGAAYTTTVASTISWFYAAAFDRTPVPNSTLPGYGDIGGLAFWTNAYSEGSGGLAGYRGNVYGIADYFVASPEFQARYPGGMSNTAFVTALYQNMLGRAPDDSGLAFWVGRMNGGASRGTVLADFTNSQENRDANPLRRDALQSYIAFMGLYGGVMTEGLAGQWLQANPTLLTTAGDAQVSVDWNGKSDTTYNLCHAREPILEFDNCGLYQEGSLLIDVVPPLVVANLVNGQRYYFRVESIRGGERSVSLLASALPVATAPTSRHIIYVVDSAGRLATVDPVFGSVNLIGRMSVVMTDIAFHPDGELFGISFFDLYRIDEATAAITRVGPHGVPGGNSLVFSRDGTLYAAGSESFNLFQIHPSSGATSNLGSTGFRAAGDLAFFGSSLFLASRDGALVKVDLADLSRTVAVGYFNRTDVYGLAPSDGGALYGVAGTDIFKVNDQTGARRDIVSFGGKGLGSAYGMDSRVVPVVDENRSKPLFPIDGYEDNPLNRLNFCFGAHGPDPTDTNKLRYFSGQYHSGVDLRTSDIGGGVIRAPVDGTLVYFRLLDEMNTFVILAGDDGRDYLFAHVDCIGVNGQGQSICVRAGPPGDVSEPYPLGNRRRVSRGDVLGTTYPSNGSIGYVRHLHFGVSTQRMVSDDGHLLAPFRSRWGRILYEPSGTPDVLAARDRAINLGFIDPLTLYETWGPSGCECLYATDSSFCRQE